MEEALSQIVDKLLSEYGVLGMAVIGLVLYILKLQRDHRAERAELVQSLKDLNATALDSFNRNTAVLSEVKTLITSKP